MRRKIRIGSRDSKLAVTQSEIIMDSIRKAHPDIELELITMKTTGDRILDRSLDKVGGKGLFVKELDQALLEERIDISVHSLKDMPMEIPEELPLVAFSKREDARDVLIAKGNFDIRKGIGLIGSSSNRRTLQLSNLYPNLEFRGIRGNVQTRLRKLEEEDYDAIVLALAGIRRLGLEHLISRIFTTQEIIPAAGQGILVVQGRKGQDYSFLDCVADREARIAAICERSFVTELNGGCSSPIAAYATVSGQEVRLEGLYYNEQDGTYRTGNIHGDSKDAVRLGSKLARQLRS
ncbi:MAG TPA: hydroxymethylbilane synthase [Lachnospiraceae bacterium]|nr:hydroxymethylbilane synthase [Lachnospiraceae bacterium]